MDCMGKENQRGLKPVHFVIVCSLIILIAVIAFAIYSYSKNQKNSIQEGNLPEVLFELVKVGGYSGTKQELTKTISGNTNTYDFVVNNGFSGDGTQWILLLVGASRETNVVNYVPTIGDNKNWFVGEIDSGISAASSKHLVGIGDPNSINGHIGDTYLNTEKLEVFIKGSSGWAKISETTSLNKNGVNEKAQPLIEWKQLISLLLGAAISLASTAFISWEARRSGIASIVEKLIVELEGNLELVKSSIDDEQIDLGSPLWEIVPRSDSLLHMGIEQYAGVVNAFIEIQFLKAAENIGYADATGKVDTQQRTKTREDFIRAIEDALVLLKGKDSK